MFFALNACKVMARKPLKSCNFVFGRLIAFTKGTGVDRIVHSILGRFIED